MLALLLSADALYLLCYLLVGMVTGVLAGLFGVGGGTIIVPVLVIMFGLRPAVKAIIASTPAPVPAMAGMPGGAVPALDGPAGVEALARVMDTGPTAIGSDGPINLIEDVTSRMNRSPQKRLEQIVEFDEAQAAAILKQWLHGQGAA